MLQIRHQKNRELKQQYWQPYFLNWKESGLTIASYCRQHHLNESQFRYWYHQLGAVSQPTKTALKPIPLFTEVKPITDISAQSSSVTGVFELLLKNGCCLKIAPHFDAPALQRLLTLLEVF